MNCNEENSLEIIKRKFIEWRGEAPVSGYSRDIDQWHQETEELWECWKTAWETALKTDSKRTKSFDKSSEYMKRMNGVYDE